MLLFAGLTQTLLVSLVLVPIVPVLAVSVSLMLSRFLAEAPTESVDLSSWLVQLPYPISVTGWS